MLVFLVSCDKKELHFESNAEVNHFIWRGLNSFYFWQEQVTNLSDVRFPSNSEYNAFLNSENDNNSFFDNLLYQKEVVDKWSWIVEDYVDLENSLKAISMHNGMEFGLVYEKNSTTDIFGYVRYVLPNTDAASKNIERGMVFKEINGTPLTVTNYIDLLFSNSSYTIHLADYNNGNPITNGNTIALTKNQHQENPVFKSNVINQGAKKIGYLMYNSFTTSFDDELNTAILNLKTQGITDLILDLRYNSGGSVRSAIYVSSMITGQFTGQLFAKKYWNSKFQSRFDSQDLVDHFTDKINNGIVQEPINSLHLNEVYIITTRSSASASELVINCLKPYIDVKTIGTKTTGKYVGSITLYDSPDLYNKTGINPNHNWAMQPITVEYKNKLDINDKDGFDPDILFAEEYNNLGVLGELSDPLLQRTITYITTGAKGKPQKQNIFPLNEFSSSRMALPTRDNMYAEIKN